VALSSPELGGECGAEGGDGLGESVLVGHQAVDVALDDDRAVRLRIAARARSRAYSVCPFT
jgi:hypothetical protein